MVILMNHENSWVIRILIVQELEVMGIEGQEDALIGFRMCEVRWIVCAHQRRNDIPWRLNVVASHEKHLLQPSRVDALIQIQA